MSEKDLVYLGTIMLLSTRGGSVTGLDINQAIKAAQAVFDIVFEKGRTVFE